MLGTCARQLRHQLRAAAARGSYARCFEYHMQKTWIESRVEMSTLKIW